MMGLIFGLLGRMLVGALLFGLILFFFSLASTVRLLPRLIEGIRRIVRTALILSFRFYRLILVRVRPALLEHLGVDILADHTRLVACLLLSLAFGLIPLVFISLANTAWILGASILHGLLVGLAWDDIENPGGVQLGVDR